MVVIIVMSYSGEIATVEIKAFECYEIYFKDKWQKYFILNAYPNVSSGHKGNYRGRGWYPKTVQIQSINLNTGKKQPISLEVNEGYTTQLDCKVFDTQARPIEIDSKTKKKLYFLYS